MINFKDTCPLYTQITDYYISEILNGNLKNDDELPSIRALAKKLSVSVITIRKAYSMLENLGYITTIPKKRCFVSAKTMRDIDNLVMAKLDKHMQNIAFITYNHRIDKEKVFNLLNSYLK